MGDAGWTACGQADRRRRALDGADLGAIEANGGAVDWRDGAGRQMLPAFRSGSLHRAVMVGFCQQAVAESVGRRHYKFRLHRSSNSA
jgi:hypothetical protein